MALLRAIKAAQRLGFTLDEVAEVLVASRSGRSSPDLQLRTAAKIREIDATMAQLAEVRASLQSVLNAECDDLAHCTCLDCPIPLPAGL